jgi:hypothetical protein
MIVYCPTQKSEGMKWEIFLDNYYYDMWAVRLIENEGCNLPILFHLVNKEDAEKLKELLEKTSIEHEMRR